MLKDIQGKPIKAGDDVYAVGQYNGPDGSFPFLDKMKVIGFNDNMVTCKLGAESNETHVRVPANVLLVVQLKPDQEM